MSTGNSITALLSGVKQADQAAVHDLFARCYARIAEIGHAKLARRLQRGFDANDAANSAFREFLSRAATGKFKKLENREDVWQILTLLVGDKIKERQQHEGRKKRGGGKTDVPLHEIVGAFSNLDDPALATEFADVRDRFLLELPSDQHRRVVELLEAGSSQEEIAQNLNVSVRTVARRLDVIRSVLPRVLGIADAPYTANVILEQKNETNE